MIENIGTTLNNVTMRGLGFFTQPLLKLTRGKLWLQVLVGMVLGIGAGLALSPDTGWVERPTALAVGEWLALPGNLFLIFIQMIVVPLILSSIIRGLSSATDIQQLKSTGIWLATYFLSTTLVAVVIGISLALLLQPGMAIDASSLTAGTDAAALSSATDAVQQREPLSLTNVPERITGVLPRNPLGAIAEGRMLQIVIFAIVLGIGLLSLPPASAKPLLELLGSVQQVCMAVVGAVMTFAPVAVFGLLAQAMIRTGPSVIAGLGYYAGTVIFGMFLLLVFFLLVATVLGRRNPWHFFKAIREPFLLAFSTNSSAATMPITAKCAEGPLRIRPSLAQFVIPLGAAINMSGSALYQALGTVFMAQMFQIDLPVSALVALTFTAVGASLGTPAVPGVGIIMLATVLNAAGIPLAGLALIIGLDQVLERFRTSLNITGDLVGATVLDRFIPASISREAEAEAAEAMRTQYETSGEDVLIQESGNGPG
ncbi:dicarboxylate/amino acid:cation symporter [Ectothiorhodospiraceae bacterium WFHF3C12]|nr:dicarboxylate/amino acid:cation symporter [Ectothiorhodospiraceae bacterium WFHF3C12]